MEVMNQLQATLHRALFRPPYPVIVTEKHADPVELVFQAFLRLDPEQRGRLVQRLKWRWGGPPKPPNLKGRERLREAATTDDELRNKNTDLGNKINEVLRNHPELWGVADEIALKQGLWVQVGTSFLERVQANLQERARAIIELRPDLERLFDA